MTGRAYTHPDVFTLGVAEGWAEAETDPTRIDWPARQAAAAIPFEVIDGRPVNPCETTPVRHGRNEMGRWGETLMADALVTVTIAPAPGPADGSESCPRCHAQDWGQTPDGRAECVRCLWSEPPQLPGRRFVLMVERRDGYGWAVPGGHVEPGESGTAAAVRELAEETGLAADAQACRALPPRYVPDPRASDEAWAVTIPVHIDLGTRSTLPAVAGGDDAARAAWIPAGTYGHLADALQDRCAGKVFAAHVAMLRQFLTGGPFLPPNPVQALEALGAVWSPDFGAYASGQLDASRVRCVLCGHAPCECPPFGTPAYLALLDRLHGCTRSGGAR
jgi:8-oxo-dGTP pyrophosphatase MutT (NUDIX family)